MAVNRLCTIFRQITINKQSNIIGRYCSSHVLKEQNNNLRSHNYSKNVLHVAQTELHIKFIPRTLNIDFGNLDGIMKKNINEIPLPKYIPSIEEPLTRKPIQQDMPLTDKSFQLPPTVNGCEKLAKHLIVIRRQKMKKHKRRKLRKRMQFVWTKLRAKRNSLREKTFQAELIAKIKDAQSFDVKKYIEERLAILDKEILPKTYKGEILSAQVIRQFLKEDREKWEKRKNKPRLTLD
ncbi:hypothetical protein WH47_06481 [Habropoda laboriosa]|uniref:Ribosomal protein mS38 C-terminal domain-containing protein n=1 Tax=Habropoda laboriosa TaxID=597456 RepID=A0A0L7RCZ5_9HYME|nr:PREDICTED: uncharacterized protein LOC108579666 [Habropoda laboriosa]KOC68689.1 hypothetical protein WH47_06481 [Habropoda laboriosa]